MICMFSPWAEAFPCHRDTASTMNKILSEKLSYFGISAELHNSQGTCTTGHMNQFLCKIWLILQCFHCIYHPQSSSLLEWTNGVIKTQLAKTGGVFRLGLRLFPLALLNLRPTLFSKHRLSPFAIFTSRSMRLDQGMYEPVLLKGDLFLYCKELLRALKTNSQLVEQSFHNVILRDGDLQHHGLQPGDPVYWKWPLHKDAL